MRPGVRDTHSAFIAGTTDASAVCSIDSTGTLVFTRLDGPSACVDAAHWLR